MVPANGLELESDIYEAAAGSRSDASDRSGDCSDERRKDETSTEFAKF
jgi:hypothetical protein